MTVESAGKWARAAHGWELAALALVAVLAAPAAAQGATIGDYGHAPDKARCLYVTAPATVCHLRTREQRDGPIHTNPIPIHLGSTVDTESGPEKTLKDSDDDGFSWSLKACGKSTVTFVIDASHLPPQMLTSAHVAYLNAWFDWNKRGNFTGGSRCATGRVPKWGVQNFPVTLDQLAGSPAMLVTVPLIGGEQVGELWIRATLTVDHKLQSKFEMQGGGKFSLGETEDYLVHEGTVPPAKKKKKKKKKGKGPLLEGEIWCGPAWINDDEPGSSALVWMGASFPGPYQVTAEPLKGSNFRSEPTFPGFPGFTVKSTREIDVPAVPFAELNWVDVTISNPVDGIADRILCPVWIFHEQDVPPLRFDIGIPNLNDPADESETWAEDVLKYWLGLGPAPPEYEDWFGPTGTAARARASSSSASPSAHASASSAVYGGVASPVNGEVLSVAIKGTVRPSGMSGEPLVQGNGGVFSLAHIQLLRPQPDGSMTIISTSGGFNMPVGGDPNQVTVVHPFNMCVQKGDELDFNWEGGFDPLYYPHGVAMQVFHARPGPSIGVYHKHNGTMNGANFRGTAEQNTELLMQAQIGTGPAASSNCPGGTGPSQKTPPPGSI